MLACKCQLCWYEWSKASPNVSRRVILVLIFAKNIEWPKFPPSTYSYDEQLAFSLFLLISSREFSPPPPARSYIKQILKPLTAQPVSRHDAIASCRSTSKRLRHLFSWKILKKLPCGLRSNRLHSPNHKRVSDSLNHTTANPLLMTCDVNWSQYRHEITREGPSGHAPGFQTP